MFWFVWLQNPDYINHRIYYQTIFDNNQSALSQTMRTVCQPITACSKILGTPQDAGTRLATALRRRPFSACNKGNRTRLHAGNSQRATKIALLVTDLPLTTCFWARISTQHFRLAWRARHWYFKRNQFEQQWFDVISFHKPRRVYPAIWYSLKPFAKRKGRFKLPTPAKCTLSKDKALTKKVLKFKTFWVQEIRF